MQELSDYYTLWAHQIKTPISVIRLLLQSGDYNEASLEQELFKIEQYAQMVLQYLRLESISSDLNLKEYALNSIVKQAVKKYTLISVKCCLPILEYQGP
jgi:signal transduction histidine kinase